MAEISMWKKIYDHLSDNGFEVYGIGKHQGYVLTSYVVVKNSGSSQIGNFSSMKTTYDVMCYVPQESHGSLESFVDSVKTAMKGLFPMVVYDMYETPEYLEDEIKGYMISVRYRTSKKFNNM